MLRIRSLSVLLLSLVTSCATQTARPAGLDDLAGTWQFVGEVPVGARIPTLTVHRDGRVGGTAGVNRYQATLNTGGLTDGRFRVAQLTSTEMAGPRYAMQLESSFQYSLTTADRALVAGELMVLKKGDRTLLRFRRVTRG